MGRGFRMGDGIKQCVVRFGGSLGWVTELISLNSPVVFLCVYGGRGSFRNCEVQISLFWRGV